MIFFLSGHECGTKIKFRVPMRNRSSGLRIPRSDALATELQRVHGEREIFVFPDYQNLPAEFSISSSYFDIRNKSISDIKELFLIP